MAWIGKIFWKFMVLGLVCPVLFALIILSGQAAGNDWVGDYSYSEQPARALAGYMMVMDWMLSIEPDGKAVLEVEGQQTSFTIQARVEGNSREIRLVFDKGLEGFGFEYLHKGDVLFQMKREKGQLLTWWHKLTPRLSEKYINGSVYFIKKF